MAEQFFVIPAGQRPSRCTGETCSATIYWARNPKTGRAVPVDCSVPGGRTPSETAMHDQLDAFAGVADVHDGRGVSHFTTCPDADQFSGAGRARSHG